jgi:hypothetical protein
VIHRRYPVAHLAALMRVDELAAMHRLEVSSIDARAYVDRGVTWKVADRLAVAAGFHPALVWPEWLDDGIEAVRADERRRAREKRRRYLARHEHARASNRVRRRRYYAENRSYEQLRNAQRDRRTAHA